MCNVVRGAYLYSRTSLTRGFWEEKNRSKKPRVVEVPRVREGS